jgi:hypothetical protein
LTDKTLKLEDLAHFIGSEEFYRHGLVPSVIFTEGAKYVADTAGAHWLLDSIALHGTMAPTVRVEEFQVWKLVLGEGNSATLSCGDGNENVVFAEDIPFTDFPLPEFTLWMVHKTIMLPSEY